MHSVLSSRRRGDCTSEGDRTGAWKIQIDAGPHAECKVALYLDSSHVIRLVVGMRHGERVRGE